MNGVCVVRVGGRDLLASAGDDYTVRIWDPNNGVTERTLHGHTDKVSGVCAMRVGGSELLASASADRTVRIWDPATGAQRRTLTGHTHLVNGVCTVRVDGRELLASASDDATVRIWDPASGAPKRTLDGHSHGQCCIKPMGALAMRRSGRWTPSGTFEIVPNRAYDDPLYGFRAADRGRSGASIA